MKAVLISPSPLTPKPHILKTDDSEPESCYFPRCRKDANCDCEMCLASINATLDLMPMSAQKITLAKISESKQIVEKTPVSIKFTLSSTPESSDPRTPSTAEAVTPPGSILRSTEKSGDTSKIQVKKRKLKFGWRFGRWPLLLGMIFVFDLGLSWMICKTLRPALSREMMRDVIKDCSSVEGLTERLDLVKKHLEGVLGDGVLSCNLGSSTWKIDQDGMFKHSHCTMYRSEAEEVIVRGWPLQTAGLLTAGFSSRSFNVLFGRLSEWPEGYMVHVVRDEKSTWILRRWGASVVRFDANTWIIEYNKNMLLDDPSILLAAVKFLYFRITQFVVRMRQHVWLLPNLSYYSAYISEGGPSPPT